jgi:hypothetical protein
VALPDPVDQAALGQAIGAAFGAYQEALGGREVASLRDLPPMTDRNRDMRRVLDNVAQGLVTIDLAGRLSLERSRVVDQRCGEFQPDGTFRDYVARIDQDFADSFEVALEQLVEGVMPEEMLLA